LDPNFVNLGGGSSLDRVELTIAGEVSATGVSDRELETVPGFRTVEEAWGCLRGRGEGGR
jgi:hypothetical protein